MAYASVKDLSLAEEHPSRDNGTYVADLCAAVRARLYIGSQTLPLWFGEMTATMVAKDARLSYDALSVAAGILLKAFVGLFTRGNASLVLFTRSGDVNDDGRGEMVADGEKALVLREQIVEVRHGEFDGSSVVAMR
jgi:hypothetical protein